MPRLISIFAIIIQTKRNVETDIQYRKHLDNPVRCQITKSLSHPLNSLLKHPHPPTVIHCRCNFTQNLTVYALISVFGIYDFRFHEAESATRVLSKRKFKQMCSIELKFTTVLQTLSCTMLQTST